MNLLSDGEPNPLIALFRQCVVCILDEAGRFRGSGFFVAPGRVATCGHVVHGGVPVHVRWRDQETAVSGIVAVPSAESVADPRAYPLPDLAVLDVEEAAGWGHPCVALAAEQPALSVRDGLYLAGYTVEHGGGPALTGATTEFESLIREDGHTFYKLKRGLILPGFSGSPLLDLRSGVVAGIVESTRSGKADLGGFAVPATELAAAFPETAQASLAFRSADGRWDARASEERVYDAERVGARGRLRLRRPFVPLAPDEDLSPAQIMRPRHAVVGYVGRERLLGELAAWCERDLEDGESTALWMVTGEGGFGKTRLAVEACREAEARGWTAGLLEPDVSDAGLTALAEWPGRQLIAVDYAEANPELIARLVREMEARAPRPAVRIMLLVRRRSSRADLLRMLNPQQEEQLDALLRKAAIVRLGDADSEVDRVELFRRAIADFAPYLGPKSAGYRLPQLRASHFGRPLYVLAAAWLTVGQGGTDVDDCSEADLLRALLDRHEARHWDRISRQCGLDLDPADQRTSVAVATLLTAEGVQEALTVARLIPHLGHDPESRLIAVARWLARLYSPSREGQGISIAPLEPDRLGEVLVGDTLREYPTLLSASIDSSSDRQVARILTVAARVAQEDDIVNTLLRSALDDRLPELLERGIHSEDRDLFSAVAAAAMVSRPTRGALDAAARFPEPVPVGLHSLAAELTALAVEGLREKDDSDPAVTADLAGWLSNLSCRLSEIGEWERALEAAQESAEHFRQLAQADADAYLPYLARSLGNLANRLREVGKQETALGIAREAAIHCRSLADANPGAYLADLGMALNNLGITLAMTGERDTALEVLREAVEIRRELARAAPDTQRRDLATTLNNLGNLLGEVGRWKDAVQAAREAVEIRRELVRDDSFTAYPDLALSLTNLGTAIQRLGKHDEALRAAREAADIYSGLAEVNPAYLPGLGMALNNLGSALRNVEDPDASDGGEGMRVAQEAVDVYSGLAAVNSVHLPGLAMAMLNLAVRLGEAGECRQAAETARQATDCYRRLAQASPLAYQVSLAESLVTLTAVLHMAGEWPSAMEAGHEAAAHYREFAQADPSAHVPGLAMALTNLNLALRDAGEQDEALAVAQEAAACYRQLAGVTPGAYLPRLGAVLNNLSATLRDVGQHSEALAVAREAAEIHRTLAEVSRVPHLPGLSAALRNLATSLWDNGEQQEALEAAREAVAIRWELAQASPPAHISALASSLSSLARILGEVGQADQAEKLFTEILRSFSGSATASGHVLRVRGQWRGHLGSTAEAITDLTDAVDALARDGSDRSAYARARQSLRVLRKKDATAFDHAWEQTGRPLPIWLSRLDGSVELLEKFVAWFESPDWDASKAYLRAHAADLLTDEAEALMEFLADGCPASDRFPGHLLLQRAARMNGIDTAYAALQEQRLAWHLSETLGQWLAAPSWTASRDFASACSDELLHPETMAILDANGNQDPANQVVRLHRGLLTYAGMEGLDEAYALLADVNRQKAMIADPAVAEETRRAAARLHSGLVSDDPEAHFELARLILLAVPNQDSSPGTDSVPVLAREAAAALADCAANAAPWEQREFARRLRRLSTGYPSLAPYLPELEKQLTGEMPAP